MNDLEWTPLGGEEAERLLMRALYRGRRGGALDELDVQGRAADLTFYSKLKLYRLGVVLPSGVVPDMRVRAPDLFLLADSEHVFVLDGTSTPVHAANAYEELDLAAFDDADEVAADYLRFFCFAVRGEQGPFLLFEKAVPPDDRAGPDGDPDPEIEGIAGMAQPIAFDGRDEAGYFRFRARVKYADGLFQALFVVKTDGNVEMLDDEPLLADLPRQPFPTLPPLHSTEYYLRQITGLTAAGGSILTALVELLLDRALRAQAETRLLTHFNAKLEGNSALDRFAEIVATSAPVVVIESTLPFIEDTVAQVVRDRKKDGRRTRWVHPAADPQDDTRIRLDVPERGPAVVLLPFHAYRGLVDAERVAHEVASRDVACLIGCQRLADLPDSLREVVDLVLPLPRFDADLFGVFFTRVTGSPPPEGWREEATHWTTHVHHTDFQHPRGLGLSPEDTFAYVQERAQERLRAVEPVGGLSLADLHGMVEARAFAEDLIADIHEAIAGRLDWEHVDRGVLLAGPPGTGKTTLARAVAKDCGVRFVSASAAGWQAAGHLGDHIRAMRSDFALARRFAPSILFIDEIDSIGSRERFSGHNTQYSVQVVNALLEQLQGMDPAAPVVVIAATNYADRVDPALRRAGRLDRTIEIPYPNTESLADIFAHYLDEYAGEERADDIDLRALGGLAFGLTGADIEFFVRGALRRARRAGRPVSHADLVAEVTRKPRDPDAAPRLTPEEVHRVAVHEAGHALAAFLSSTGGADLTYVSIVPRSDGTLGFVARMPSERLVVTRAEYVERLEVVLAGRAAEEIIFGADGVTSGAQHDLQIATKSALLMTTQYGLGPDGDLLWSEVPSVEQREEAGRVLHEAYAKALEMLRANVEELEALATTLQTQQELTGDEIRRLVEIGGA